MRGVAKQDLSAVQNISSQSSRPLEVDVTEQKSGLIVLPSVSVSGRMQRGPVLLIAVGNKALLWPHPCFELLLMHMKSSGCSRCIKSTQLRRRLQQGQ